MTKKKIVKKPHFDEADSLLGKLTKMLKGLFKRGSKK